MENYDFKIVSLPAYARNGTIFLLSLLDSHPQILLIPTTLEFYPVWRYINGNSYTNIKELLEVFVSASHLKYPLNSKPTPGINIDSVGDKIFSINKIKFYKYVFEFFENHKLTRKNFFLALHEAFLKCRGRKWSQIKVLFSYNHDISSFEDFFDDFPELQIIHMLRDPRASYYSNAVFCEKKYFKGASSSLFLYCLFNFVKGIVSYFKFSEMIVPERQFLIKHEIIHHEGTKTMKKLSCWLGINFDDILLQSTIDGIPWLGNSNQKKKVSGFTPSLTIPKWKSNLNGRHLKLIETLALKFMIKNGYHPLMIKKKISLFNLILIPSKNEISGLFLIFRKMKYLNNKGIDSSFLQTSLDHKLRKINKHLPKFLRLIKAFIGDIIKIIFYPVYRPYFVWKLLLRTSVFK